MASFMQKLARTKNIGKRSKKKYLEEALYKNLFKEGSEENHVRKNLNQFLKSHKSAFKWEVGKSIKVLRQRKLYAPALKVSHFLSFFFFWNCMDLTVRTLHFCMFSMIRLENTKHFCIMFLVLSRFAWFGLRVSLGFCHFGIVSVKPCCILIFDLKINLEFASQGRRSYPLICLSWSLRQIGCFIYIFSRIDLMLSVLAPILQKAEWCTWFDN